MSTSNEKVVVKADGDAEEAVEKKAEEAVEKKAEEELKKIITLRSSDGESFNIDVQVANMSITIKNMIDDIATDDGIPVPNVTGEILCKVIEYCKKHVNAPNSKKNEEDTALNAEAEQAEKDLEAWDAEFVKVDRSTLFNFILAANYLDIKDLMDLTCQTVADAMKDLSVEEVREMFNIENDFTEAEESAIRKEHAWAHEI